MAYFLLTFPKNNHISAFLTYKSILIWIAIKTFDFFFFVFQKMAFITDSYFPATFTTC